ncbi:MAG: magnesium transporter [Ardenticatenaceae bacterium]|nr:magnesium transporter [Ardenticatenaceae bacterium]
MDQTISIQDLVARIETLVATDGSNKAALRELLGEFHPADIAEVMDELSDQAALAVFNLLPRQVASEVLDETDLEIARFIFEELPNERLADLLEELPMDDAARLLAELPDATAQDLIQLMQPEEAADVRDLLAYPEETAGRLMTSHFVRLRSTWTVGKTSDYLRHLDPETETITYLYAVDEADRLVGVVPMRAMLTARPEQTIAEIMNPRVVSVRVETDQEELAEVVAKYDFFAIPVVDAEGRLVGIVTVDDVVDILEEEATEDIQRLGGSEPLDQPYFTVPVPYIARKRIGWLLLLFVAETFTGSVLRFFENELAQVVALSFFIPLLIGTGGNAGSQTVSTIIRALAVGEIEWRDALRVLGREFSTGLLVGVLLGVFGFGRALLWGTGIPLALVVGFTLPAIVTWANTVGSLVPLLAEKVGLDPTVISAPLITTVVDATGLAIYFLVAKAVLGL